MFMTKPAYNRGKGKAVAWLRDHAAYDGDECLIWPFSRIPEGYGMFGYLGELLYAHRFMCEIVHGPAPSKKHQAAHSCGNGHEGCVNQNHLSWKDKFGNAQDRVKHGNQSKAGRVRNILTLTDVSEILAFKGKVSQYLLAPIYGVSRETISAIHTGRDGRVKSFNARS